MTQTQLLAFFFFFRNSVNVSQGNKITIKLSKPEVGYLLEELPCPENIHKVKTKAKLGITGIAGRGNGKQNFAGRLH